MLRQVVKVQRDKIAPCITCPLCNKFFRDATTISECLHSFCRKCIYKKINDEEFDTCPVCDINLGCSPLEKLRADHSLEDLKTKLFSSKRKKVKSVPVQAAPPVSLPVRRKEISLSSLVASPPKVLPVAQVVLQPSKRLKAMARKNPALREPISSDIEKPVQKVDDCHEKRSSSSPENLSKIIQATRQNSTPDTFKHLKSNKDSEENTEPCEGNADLWKPLTHLVDVADKSKIKKSTVQEIPVQTMQLPDPAEKEAQVLKFRVEEQISRPKVNGDVNYSAPSSSGSVKTRKLQASRQKRALASEGLNISAQAIVGSSCESDGRFNPIWFALIACDDQDGDAPLPQISSCYLRVKDGSLPVSSIKKYLAQKLGLANEAEVEIWLQGQPVGSALQLHDLIEWWLQTAPTSEERIKTRVGSSAKDFVMVLSYTRKLPSP